VNSKPQQDLTNKTLKSFLDEGDDEYEPSVKARVDTDPEFSLSWQRLIVNIEDLEDLKEFTRICGIVITPKTDEIIYEHNPEPTGLFNFLSDD